MISKYFFHLTEKLKSRKNTHQYLIGQMISLSQSRNHHRCQHCRGNVVHLVLDDTSKDIRDTIDVVANSWNQFGKIHQILPFRCAKRLFGTRYANRVTIRSLVTLNSDSSNWKQCCSEFCSGNRNIFCQIEYIRKLISRNFYLAVTVLSSARSSSVVQASIRLSKAWPLAAISEKLTTNRHKT